MKWQAEGPESIRVAVNISGYQLQNKKLLEVVNRILEETGMSAAIATAIIAMGNSLNLNVIAERGVTQAQYDFLKENKCGQVQGYLFSRPLPSDEIVNILRQNKRELAGQE